MARTFNLEMPKQFTSALELVETVDDEAFAAVLERLSALDLSLPDPTLAAEMVSDDLPLEEAESLLAVVFATAHLVANIDHPQSEILDAIAESFEPKDEDRLKSRLAALLETKFASLRAHAMDLITDAHDRFLNARVFTDIRPLFDPKVTEPTNAVVIHTLRLAFQADRRRTVDLRISVDQLRELVKTLERAEDKDKALHESMSKLGMVDLTPREAAEQDG